MMHKAIQVRLEGIRGCGWRKPGGIYLVSKYDSDPCGKLPIPCEICPCCGRGIIPARGWTWIKPDELLRAATKECSLIGTKTCVECIIARVISGQNTLGLAGLIWVGIRYYPTMGHFNREADIMGVCRRTNFVPKEFKLGKTYVLLGHRKAIIEYDVELGSELIFKPGIFRIFKPEAIEIVVTGDEPDYVIEKYIKRGLTPVVIETIEDIQDGMELDNGPD